MDRTLQIQLLGNFQLQSADGTLIAFDSSRLQSLLAYLLLHAGSPQPRQQIAYAFWPVSEESQARTNLRKLFLQLRRALPDADGYLIFDNQTIQWQTDAPWTCDVHHVQLLLKQLRENPLDQDALTALFERYRGELLPSCYDDWIVPLRERLHQDVMAALDHLVTLLENQRAYGEGIRYAQRLLSFDPLEEKSYQRLMRLRAADGDRAGALKVYAECAEILERELGVEPSAETAALYEQLRQAKSTLVTPQMTAPTKSPLPPLVGRQTEWQILRNAWQQAVRGRARFVTIAGEAGIGKTRLAEELLIWAEQQGIAAVRTRSYQAQGALAYAPIAELLQAENIARRVQLLNENRLTQVARLLPKLLEEHPNLTPPQPMTESWQRQQFFDALAHAILADGQPLLLLFDDLQWADGETLTWLHFLLRAAATSPLLIVGTIRTGEIADDHPLPSLLDSLRRDDLLTEIALAPLNAEEVQALAQSLQDGDLADEQLARLYADTEGNPLFVVESVRARQDAPQDQDEGAAQSGLPPKIYSVIRSRLTQLSPETQTLVNLAAVIGRSFTYDVLMEASAMGEDEVVDSLDELLARQIIREQSGDSYDFSHDRIRDVAYSEISRIRRRLLHRRVAEALELLHAQDHGAVSGLLAEHHRHAGNAEQAVNYWFMASRRSAEQFAYGEALRYLARIEATAAPIDDTTNFQLLDQRLHIHAIQSKPADWDADLTALQTVVERCSKQQPDQFHQFQGWLTFHQLNYHQQLGQYQTAIRYAKMTIEHAEHDHDVALEARALLGWGLAAWLSADFDEAKAKLELALQRARTAALPAVAATSLERIMQVYIFSGGSAQRIKEALDECLALYQKANDQNGVAAIHNKYGYLPVAQGVGDYEQARKHYEQGLAIYREIGHQIGTVGILRNLGVLYTCVGDYGRAEAVLQEALAVENTINRDDFAAVVSNYLGFAYFHSGRLDDAKAAQEQALQELKSQLWRVKALTALGWINFYLQDTKTAFTYLTQALRLARELNEVRQEGYTLTCMGHLFVEQQNFTEAATVYRQAHDAHQRMEQANRAMEPMAGLAWVAQQQGEATVAMQQVEKILDHLCTHTLDRTEDGFYVYLLCYRILAANQDARAMAFLQTIYEGLQSRAATIDDPEHCRLFWEAIPGHREICAQWEQLAQRAVDEDGI